MAKEVNKMEAIIEKAKKDFDRAFKEIMNTADKLLDEGVNANAIYLALVIVKETFEKGLNLSDYERRIALEYAKELIGGAMGMRK
jgi:sugar-specific transcriptional regulator TrmB